MKFHRILIIGVALSVFGCGKSEQPAAEPEMQGAAAEAESAAAEMATAEQMPAEDQAWRTEAFIEHMHSHAEKLDELNFALDDGDLVGAMGPAYWLGRHDEVDGIPAEWQTYLTGMRASAQAVESSRDLESARAAAAQIGKNCQGCHDAAGVMGSE